MLISNTADRLKELMETRGLKQSDIVNLCKPFSEKYGISIRRNDVSYYVTGQVKPRQDKLTILAMALGVDEAWLMGADVPMTGTGHLENTLNYINDNWITEVGNTDLTHDELKRLLEYAKFLVSQRKNEVLANASVQE